MIALGGVVAASAGLWACSSEEEGGNGAQPVDEAGVLDGAGLPTDDAAASGDGSPADAGPSTPKEACEAYFTAACKRRDECGLGGKAGCESLKQCCPDYFFSPGATRTVESLIACAAVRAAQSCDEVVNNIEPACATPGTRQPGEPCNFALQCASLTCGYGNLGTCGQCAAIRPPDAGCPGLGETCGQNMTCPSTQTGCVPNQVPPLLAIGAMCGPDAGSAQCPRSAPCAAATAQAPSGACTVPPSSGPCLFAPGAAVASICAVGTWCLRADPGLPGGECVPAGAKDALCGTAYNARPCGDGLFCTSFTQGTCQPLHKLNETCRATSECEGSLYCFRTSAQALGTCVPRVAVGQSCAPTLFDGGAGANEPACVPGASCYTFVDDGGVRSVCITRGGIGAACSPPNADCAGGLECKAGTCVVPACAVDAGPG